MTDKESNERILHRLVSVPSVSGDEHAGVGVCFELMQEIGLKTRTVACLRDPGAFNVEGTYGTGSPVLCLTGHIDTVPYSDMTVAPLGEQQGDRFYGRGASDMKGGLAAILAGVAVVIRESPPSRGTILVVATAREETIKSGGVQLAQDHPHIDGVVCAEPTGCRIAIAATGSLPLRVDVYGQPGHSSHAGSGTNAIRAAVEVVEALYQEYDNTVLIPHIGERRRGVNAGVIRGGLAQPVVPEKCSIWMDIRIFPGETKADLLQRAESVLRALEQNTIGLRVAVSEERLDYQGQAYLVGSLAHHIHVERGMLPFSSSPESHLVQTFASALKVAGGDTTLTMMSGWGDIEFLATDHGVPAIYFGPGDIHTAHTKDEHISLSKYHHAIAVYKEAIAQFFGGDQQPHVV